MLKKETYTQILDSVKKSLQALLIICRSSLLKKARAFVSSKIFQLSLINI